MSKDSIKKNLKLAQTEVEILKAVLAGKTVQWKNKSGTWMDVLPNDVALRNRLDHYFEWRVKPVPVARPEVWINVYPSSDSNPYPTARDANEHANTVARKCLARYKLVEEIFD